MPRRRCLVHPDQRWFGPPGGALPALGDLQHADSAESYPTAQGKDRLQACPPAQAGDRLETGSIWSEVGRRVLAEAQRQATDELMRRGAVPAPAVPLFSCNARPCSPGERQSPPTVALNNPSVSAAGLETRS